MAERSELSPVFLDLDDVPKAAEAGPYRDDWYGCLLHGFGANANDLVGLAPVLGGARRWVFPHAPVPITVAGMSYGRAWFPRESETIEQAVSGSYFRDLRALQPDGLRDAATMVRDMIDKMKIPWDRLVLGGFSQGAMVSAEVIRQGFADPSLPLPKTVLLFSGSLIAEEWWADLSLVHPGVDTPPHVDRRRIAIFQSHGTADSVLPFQEGQALATTLTQAGCDLTFLSFDDGHTIPLEVCQKAAAFVATRLKIAEK